jgi:putative transposase
LCDIEELLSARGINVSYETVRNWCDKFGQRYCSQIRKNRGQLGDTWYLDEVFIKIEVVMHYLWRAVGQAGDEIDILVQKHAIIWVCKIPIFMPDFANHIKQQ